VVSGFSPMRAVWRFSFLLQKRDLVGEVNIVFGYCSFPLFLETSWYTMTWSLPPQI